MPRDSGEYAKAREAAERLLAGKLADITWAQRVKWAQDAYNIAPNGLVAVNNMLAAAFPEYAPDPED